MYFRIRTDRHRMRVERWLWNEQKDACNAVPLRTTFLGIYISKNDERIGVDRLGSANKPTFVSNLPPFKFAPIGRVYYSISRVLG